MQRFKQAIYTGCLTLIMGTLIACGDLPFTTDPSASPSVDASTQLANDAIAQDIPEALRDLSVSIIGKTYTYVPMMTFLRCAADKSSNAAIKQTAVQARDALLAAFVSGDLKKAKDALNRSALGSSTLAFDATVKAGCPLKVIDTVATPMPSATPTTAKVNHNAPTNIAKIENNRIEAEVATKTGGLLKYPAQESRKGGEKVMIFSGGDAGGQATLHLPELKGKFNIKINWLNCPDSPEMALKFGTTSLTLPDLKEHTSCTLKVRDMGEHTLDIDAGTPLTMTVKGNVTGKGNAWIAIDYFEFIPA